MGRVFLKYLEGKFYSCKFCKAHLANRDEIACTDFYTSKGKAYLFHSVVNVFMRGNEDRMIETEMHTVSDIYCVQCGNLLGWKYEHSEDPNENFKTGKFLIERIHMLDPEGNEYDGDDEDILSDDMVADNP